MPMQRTDAKVIADHEKRISTHKQLSRFVRKAGVRLPKVRHTAAFEAGVRAKLGRGE